MLLSVNYKVAGRKNTVSSGKKIFFLKLLFILALSYTIIHMYKYLIYNNLS